MLNVFQECFQDKDFMNHRYLRKRAIYLAVIAKRVREVQGIQDLKYTYQNGNSLKPSLLLSYQGIANQLSPDLIFANINSSQIKTK